MTVLLESLDFEILKGGFWLKLPKPYLDLPLSPYQIIYKHMQSCVFHFVYA